MNHTKYSDEVLSAAYEVEFIDLHGITQAVITVCEEDLRVVSRSHC